MTTGNIINRVSLRTLETAQGLTPAEIEIVNKALFDIEQKLNEMINKLNLL